jgi:transmembrane sensor
MKTASDIDKEAAAWISRRDASRGAEAVEREFAAWIEADIRHRVAYLRLNAAWERTRLAERFRPLDGPIDRSLLAPAESVAPHRFMPWLSAVAALMLLGVGVVAWFVVDAQRGEVYRTAVGHFERIRLEDGSVIELNTDSELRVRMSDRRRLVSLIRGEARFKVAYDASRPFDVEADGMRVRAIGTAFSIRLRDREHAEVLVTEGRVAITLPQLKPQEISAPMPTLEAGELAVVAPERVAIASVPTATVLRRLSWTEGKLVFDEETLATAVAEFNRYNRRQLVIADPSLATLHVGGNFEATDLPSFLSALERVFGVRSQGANDEVVYLMAAEAIDGTVTAHPSPR